MSRVVILFGFCTAGKSSILKFFKNKYDYDHLRTIDTDAEISKEYGNHIYNIYTSFYRERGNGGENIKDALEYIEQKEREVLIKLTDGCFESYIPYLIAPGPNLATREPQWSYFKENINPICYHLTLTKEEVYKGLMARREKLKINKISKSKSYGCWDYNSITKYENKEYKCLSEEEALSKIEGNMSGPCKIYKMLSSENRTFSAVKIREDYDLEKKLYDSIREDLLLPSYS